MIQSVNAGNPNYLASNANNKKCPKFAKSNLKVSFGDYEKQSPFQPVKDAIVTLTDGVLGLVGFNAALWYIQSFVNGNILSGKINQYFTKNIPSEDKANFIKLAEEMNKKVPNVRMITDAQNGQAFFDHAENLVVVGKDQHSALFHEFGHAIEENSTKIFKWLQRNRGHYTFLALALYTLLAQREKPYDVYEDDNKSFGKKIKNFFSRSDAIVPILAFSPELITEAKASLEGLKFLKGKVSDVAYKNISKSYLTCFSTYLFIPLSIILLDSIRNEANKIRQRKIMQREQNI